MFILKILFSLFVAQTLYAAHLTDQLKEIGYAELSETKSTKEYDNLYASFDELIEFLQANPSWIQKLYIAKERFIRTKDKNYYSTDFFGFYDESAREGRSQIAFYYSTRFHEFVCRNHPEFKKIPEIIRFFEACRMIQEPCEDIFIETAAEIGLETIFDQPPILLKVVKYFPNYVGTKPHYDGTAFSLFLNSTDNESLLFSSYKSYFTIDDFSSAQRKLSRSILLIPGTLLSEFSIYPTPHIVVQSDKIRYATIAFAMRPNYIPQKFEFALLPNF